MRDISSGTPSQEVNFWLSLERALEGIEGQLKSEEVGRVMDGLRNGKRFHATTGLNDYMDLGGFPLLFLWDERS
jgi:hypothetical protein